MKGMTKHDLRDKLAIHAPFVSSEWFEPKMPNPRPEDSWEDLQTGFKYANENAARRDKEAVPHNAAKKEQLEWDKQWRIERTLQWPWAWSDAVISRRDTNQKSKAPVNEPK